MLKRSEPDLTAETPLGAAAARARREQNERAEATRRVNREAKGTSAAQTKAARQAAAAAARVARGWQAELGPTGVPRKVGEREKGILIGMQAAGVPRTRASEAMAISPDTARTALRQTPGAMDTIATLRAALKVLKITKAHALESQLWGRAEHEVGERNPDTGLWVGGEARDVDAIFRAILASEKVQAAAAGEGNASGAPLPGQAGSAPTVDLRVLIQALAEP